MYQGSTKTHEGSAKMHEGRTNTHEEPPLLVIPAYRPSRLSRGYYTEPNMTSIIKGLVEKM